MRRSEVLQEVRLMRFEEVNSQYRRSRLSCEEAAEPGYWGVGFGFNFLLTARCRIFRIYLTHMLGGGPMLQNS